MPIVITERGYQDSCLGRVLQLKIHDADYGKLGWEDVWNAFTDAYPGKWAVEVYPPKSAIVNGKNVYHLWVLESAPVGLTLRV